MEYTEITDADIRERNRIVRNIRSDGNLYAPWHKPQRGFHTGNNITYFCKNMLGVVPYTWQDLLFKKILKNDKDVLACTPRQVGKSFAVAVAALHAVIHNLYPIKSKGNRTIIGIVSKSEVQSKHLIAGIRVSMDMGDEYLEKTQVNDPFYKKFFDTHLSKKQTDATNKTHLTFRERVQNAKGEWLPEGKIIGEIVCIPATESGRGFTFSKLFMDEAAFFENDDFYTAIAEPTLRATKGHSVVTTTPNGQKGWFFSVFDPFDEYFKKNPYHRMWLHWRHIEDKGERDAVLKKKEELEIQGRARLFLQEYEASFTADATSFFESEKVDDLFDTTLFKHDNYEKPTDMGVDIGFKSSRTVITISRLGDDKVIRRVYHKRYGGGNDIMVVKDILNLIPKFNVQRVIIDDCAAAGHLIQALEKEGVNVKLMTFKNSAIGGKVKKYVQFKAKMYENKIFSYPDKDLEIEMKSLEEKDQIRWTKISCPKGGSDDMIDSFLISVFFFIEDKERFKIYDWDEI